jgi:DNA modification methylase
MEEYRNKIINGDVLDVLRGLPDGIADCCVTSPPYYGLRDYGELGQMGMEESPELFVEKMVEVFSEVRRVLKDDGTLWLNLGDSYCGGGRGYVDDGRIQSGSLGTANMPKSVVPIGMKQKDLMGIPWMVAFALRADGWYLRQDIIWSKPNPMPESVTDRCTKGHEYVFLLSKGSKYYYDNEAIKYPSITNDKSVRDRDSSKLNNTPGRSRMAGLTTNDYEMSNKRSVWTVNTKPLKEAHFATFPEKLIVDMIKAGCREGGLVLDPFMGAGTTALVAKKLGRDYLGAELNGEYIKIAENRLDRELGMFR